MKQGDAAAVVVADVSKRFRLYHERATSLKERVVNWRRPSYEEFWALEDVSLEILRGETAGLIGPNGSGKSTLMKLIGGIYRPTSGTIATRGRIATLLELGAGFHPDLTGRENVFLNASILGLSRKQTERHFNEIVAFAGLEDFIDLQVRHYSSGMYIRLGFAVAVHVDPEVLIIDEVLAVGDEAFQRKCLDRIRRFQREGRTIVFVTHAVDLVRAICTKAFFLHRGRLAAEGAPDEVIRAFRQQIHGEEHLEAVEGEERGSGEIRILDVRFVDAGGDERRVFEPGRPMTTQIDLEALVPVRGPVVGVAIYDEREVCVYGTTTAFQSVDLGLVYGKVRVLVRCDSLPVLSGTFRATVGVVTPDDRHVYHWREKVFEFRVVNPSGDRGSMNFNAQIDVERL